MSLSRVAAQLGLLVAAGAAAAALAAHGGRFSDRLDVLAHFAPLWLAAAIAGGLLGLLGQGRLRAATVGLAGLGAVLAAALMAPEHLRDPGPTAAPGEAASLRLIQLNTWSGRHPDLDALTDWLVSQEAGIIVLQEVKAPLLERLRRDWPHHIVCSPMNCGVAILSRAAPIATGAPEVEEGARFPMAAATFAAPGGAFMVVGAHYTWPFPAGHQQAQGRRLAAVLDHFPKGRLIVAGDFNSTPWSFTRRREDARFGVIRRTQALYSWPAGEFSRLRLSSPFPVLPIDHVYAGSDWRTVRIERGPRVGADHYPVMVSLAAD